MKWISIRVRENIATVHQSPFGSPGLEIQDYQGASPDEALGYAIRELWLAGSLDEPVRIVLDLQER